MLAVIRERAQGFIAGFIVLLIAAVFVLGSAGDYFMGGANQAAAKVNGEKITAQDVQMQYERFARENPDARSDVAFLKRQALDHLIQMAVLGQAAQDLGLTISDAQIAGIIQNIEAFKEEGVFSKEKYLQTISSAYYTDAAFRAELRQALSVQHMQDGLVGTAFSLPHELSDMIKLADQKRDLAYVTIPLKRFIDEIEITDEAVQAHYDQYAAQYTTEEKVKIAAVKLKLSDVAEGITLSTAEKQQYYDDHLGLFTSPERVNVGHILIPLQKDANEAQVKSAEETITSIQARLADGESFESLAKTFSEDPISAKDGGKLDWVRKGDLLPSFEEAAFALSNGAVSDPVRTVFGLHLIKRYDYEPESVQLFAEVKDAVEAQLQTQKAEGLFIEKAEQLSNLAFERPGSLDAIQDNLGLSVMSTAWVTRMGDKSDLLLSEPAIIAAAFSEDVLQNRMNSELIELSDQSYVVLRVTDHAPMAQMTFDEAKPEIYAALQKEAAQDKAMALAQEMQTAVERGQDMARVAKNNALTTEMLKAASRQSFEADYELIQMGFSLPVPKTEEVVVGAFTRHDGDINLVQLQSVTDGALSALSEDQQALYAQGLAKSFGELDFGLFATHLLENAEVKKSDTPA